MTPWPSWYSPLKPAPVRNIVHFAAELSGISAADIRGKSRSSTFVRVRWAIYLIARENGHKYPHIGRYVGDRDHTTIMNGVRKVERQMAKDPVFAEFVSELRLRVLKCRPVMTPAPKTYRGADREKGDIREHRRKLVRLVVTPPSDNDDDHLNDMDLLSRAVARAYA